MLLDVRGHGGVPATGVSAVALNVTVTEPSAPTFVTVHPSGTTERLAAEQGTLDTSTSEGLLGKGADLWESDEEVDRFLELIRQAKGE